MKSLSKSQYSSPSGNIRGGQGGHRGFWGVSYYTFRVPAIYILSLHLLNGIRGGGEFSLREDTGKVRCEVHFLRNEMWPAGQILAMGFISRGHWVHRVPGGTALALVVDSWRQT